MAKAEDNDTKHEYKRERGRVNRFLEKVDSIPDNVFYGGASSDARKRKLYEEGIEGRATVLKAPPERNVSTVQDNVGTFKARIEIPGREPYEAKVKQTYGLLRLEGAPERDGRRLPRVGLVLAGMTASVCAFPQAAQAHPLGQFSVNHVTYAKVSSDRIELVYILDQAEVPTFRERDLSDREVIDEKLAEVRENLTVTVNGERIDLRVAVPPGLSYADGNGGLPITRFELTLEAPISDPTRGDDRGRDLPRHPGPRRLRRRPRRGDGRDGGRGRLGPDQRAARLRGDRRRQRAGEPRHHPHGRARRRDRDWARRRDDRPRGPPWRGRGPRERGLRRPLRGRGLGRGGLPPAPAGLARLGGAPRSGARSRQGDGGRLPGRDEGNAARRDRARRDRHRHPHHRRLRARSRAPWP